MVAKVKTARIEIQKLELPTNAVLPGQAEGGSFSIPQFIVKRDGQKMPFEPHRIQ